MSGRGIGDSGGGHLGTIFQVCTQVNSKQRIFVSLRICDRSVWVKDKPRTAQAYPWLQQYTGTSMQQNSTLRSSKTTGVRLFDSGSTIVLDTCLYMQSSTRDI